jgi:hypothetical protein
MELSPEERQKIYLEEQARLEVQQEFRTQNKETSTGIIIWRIILGSFGALVVLFIIGSMMQNSDSTLSSSARPTAIQNTGNPAHDRLMALGASAQALLLGQIAGEGCSGDYVFYMGMDKETDAYWSVRCVNGRSYQVQIKPNATGSTSIMDCDLLKAVANVSCFVKLDQQ